MRQAVKRVGVQRKAGFPEAAIKYFEDRAAPDVEMRNESSEMEIAFPTIVPPDDLSDAGG
jgi:hypothetical protein